MASVIGAPWGVGAPRTHPKDCAYRAIISMKLSSSRVHSIRRPFLNLEKRAQSILENSSQNCGNMSRNITYVILLWVMAHACNILS